MIMHIGRLASLAFTVGILSGAAFAQGAPGGCFVVNGSGCPFNVNDPVSFSAYYLEQFSGEVGQPLYQSVPTDPPEGDRTTCAIDCHQYYLESRSACFAIGLVESDDGNTEASRLCLSLALETLGQCLLNTCRIY